MVEQDLIRQEQANDGFSNETPWDLLIFEPEPMSTNEIMAAYDLSLNKTTIFIFSGTGIGTVLFSTIMPIFYIFD